MQISDELDVVLEHGALLGHVLNGAQVESARHALHDQPLGLGAETVDVRNTQPVLLHHAVHVPLVLEHRFHALALFPAAIAAKIQRQQFTALVQIEKPGRAPTPLTLQVAHATTQCLLHPGKAALPLGAEIVELPVAPSGVCHVVPLLPTPAPIRAILAGARPAQCQSDPPPPPPRCAQRFGQLEAVATRLFFFFMLK